MKLAGAPEGSWPNADPCLRGGDFDRSHAPRLGPLRCRMPRTLQTRAVTRVSDAEELAAPLIKTSKDVVWLRPSGVYEQPRLEKIYW
jgi:hypothetical protein